MAGVHEKVFEGKVTVPSGSAGSFVEVPLGPIGGCDDDELVHVAVLTTAASTAGQVLIAVRGDHGPDGSVSLTHTANVIASTAISTLPTLLVGDYASTTIVGPYVHPVLKVGTNNGNAQWAEVEVWVTRKRFPRNQGLTRHRRVDVLTISSGSIPNASGRRVRILRTRRGRAGRRIRGPDPPR